MDRLREQCDTLVVSLFVNPTQFDDPADFDAYPRDEERDASLAEDRAVDLLFTTAMEGLHRPGHFVGVATVVAKLFAGLQPDLAMFGRKDAQQLAVLKAMVNDLRFPIEIVEAPIVREPDGLALSSRNVRLAPSEREQALALSRGLFQAAEQVDAGERSAQRLEATVTRALRGLDLDYVELASQETMQPIDDLDRPAVLAAAATVGDVRLIDNMAFDVADGRPRPDRGILLDEPSRLSALP
jgi:pantoate--beta-alanine ligase